MKYAIGIQCRDKSNRLKNKSTRSFYKGKSILEILLNRFNTVRLNNVFVLTSKNSSKTIEQAKKAGNKIFIGSENDVFDRYLRFVLRYKLNGVFRVCADNPFIALGLMYPIRKWGKCGRYDYVTFKDAMDRHEGLFIEYISANALTKMNTKNLTKSEREHVTTYIKKHKDEFRILELPIPPIMKSLDVRLTVDTIQDFRIAQKIYRSLGEVYWMYIYEYLHNKPRLLKKMKKNMEMNPK